MKKINIIFICLCLWACNTKEEEVKQDVVAAPVSALILKDDITKLKYVEYGLDSKVETDVQTWGKFIELRVIISQLKNGDLSSFQGDVDIIVLLMKELRQSIPETVNSPSIQARFLSLETKMLKLQSVLNLPNYPKAEQLNCVKETLVAYSNLNLQMNKKYEKDAQKIEKP